MARLLSESPSVKVGDIVFGSTSPEEAVRSTIRHAIARRGGQLHFANAWSVVTARDHLAAREAFAAGTCLPDGLPVVWAMRWLSPKLRSGRVAGPHFFEKVMEEGRDAGLRHYLLGGSTETLTALHLSLSARYPGLQIVGTSCPPFTPLDDDYVRTELEKISVAAPHIVWVGLGTPKQDLFAKMAAPERHEVFACVGAAFDMSAGRIPRAPAWMQRVGVEWIYRFAREPRRLWRRYTYGNMKFLSIVLATRFRKRSSASQ